MSPNPIRSTLFAGAAVALGLVTSSALATETIAAPDAAPLVVAQTSAAVVPAAPQGGNEDPVHLRGVRKAATENPEALRRYIWRTRMIYNHWYNDFAPKE